MNQILYNKIKDNLKKGNKSIQITVFSIIDIIFYNTRIVFFQVTNT